MKIGSKVALKLDTKLVPLSASTPRGAQQTDFKRGDVFTLVSLSGENATVKDSEGNFWSVLMEFLGLAQEVRQVDENTTIGEGLTILQSIGNFFANLFKRKKKK